MTWQPIETAPKDGTTILVYEPASEFRVAYTGPTKWNPTRDGSGYWLWQPCQPTHWMPLPPPPTESAK